MTKVQGKVFGLRAAEIGALEKLLHRRVPPARALSYDLARELSGLADALGRSVGVTIDRRGRVRGVWVDAPGRVLPAGLDPPRTGPSRFSGLRFVYATASQGGVTHVDATEAVRLRMDAWVRV
ncbi:MAG TPA: GTPase HflX, partial [Planctomycetes bacterium]|nr:GTPase HflX [Planctomycetota bacterium]